MAPAEVGIDHRRWIGRVAIDQKAPGDRGAQIEHPIAFAQPMAREFAKYRKYVTLARHLIQALLQRRVMIVIFGPAASNSRRGSGKVADGKVGGGGKVVRERIHVGSIDARTLPT
jgi:hypothetical protein